MKKLNYTVKSTQKCSHCNTVLKQNLLDKKPGAKLCYKCHRISTGKPIHHVPRRKRLEAGLPVH